MASFADFAVAGFDSEYAGQFLLITGFAVISAETLINMLIITGKHLRDIGEEEKAVSQFRIALKVIEAFEEDFLETK
jgi:hypothetical protein